MLFVPEGCTHAVDTVEESCCISKCFLTFHSIGHCLKQAKEHKRNGGGDDNFSVMHMLDEQAIMAMRLIVELLETNCMPCKALQQA